MAAGAVLRDTPGKQPPCLHERIFAGQRTANGFSRELSAVSRGSDGGRDFPYPIVIHPGSGCPYPIHKSGCSGEYRGTGKSL